MCQCDSVCTLMLGCHIDGVVRCIDSGMTKNDVTKVRHEMLMFNRTEERESKMSFQ